MRIGFTIILVLALLCACTETRQGENNPTGQADSVNVESVPLEADTEGTVPPPRSADEFFDDFIYSFISNKTYQYARITFPLPYTYLGEKKTITRQQWRFDKIYANEDFYVSVFDSSKETQLEKDTSIGRVIVTWFYFDKQQTKQYIFERRAGIWLLTKLTLANITQHPDKEFLMFYTHFASDESFQRKALAHEIVFKSYDYENMQDIEGYVDADQWFTFRPSLPSGNFVVVNYGQRVGYGKHRIFVIRGISNSMMNVLYFEQHPPGAWLLVGFEN